MHALDRSCPSAQYCRRRRDRGGDYYSREELRLLKATDDLASRFREAQTSRAFSMCLLSAVGGLRFAPSTKSSLATTSVALVLLGPLSDDVSEYYFDDGYEGACGPDEDYHISMEEDLVISLLFGWTSIQPQGRFALFPIFTTKNSTLPCGMPRGLLQKLPAYKALAVAVRPPLRHCSGLLETLSLSEAEEEDGNNLLVRRSRCVGGRGPSHYPRHRLRRDYEVDAGRRRANGTRCRNRSRRRVRREGMRLKKCESAWSSSAETHLCHARSPRPHQRRHAQGRPVLQRNEKSVKFARRPRSTDAEAATFEQRMYAIVLVTNCPVYGDGKGRAGSCATSQVHLGSAAVHRRLSSTT